MTADQAAVIEAAREWQRAWGSRNLPGGQTPLFLRSFALVDAVNALDARTGNPPDAAGYAEALGAWKPRRRAPRSFDCTIEFTVNGEAMRAFRGALERIGGTP